jgi:hypothetical protein
MTMYIVGICRFCNSVAELQGWPTSQILLDIDTNSSEDPAAAALSEYSSDLLCVGECPSERWYLFAMLHDAVSYQQQSLWLNEFFGKTVE